MQVTWNSAVLLSVWCLSEPISKKKKWRQHRRYLLTSSITPPSGLIRRLNLCFHCLFMSVHTHTHAHTQTHTLISFEDKMLMSSCSTSNLILQLHCYYTRNITRWHLTLRIHLFTKQQWRSEIFLGFYFWFCVLSSWLCVVRVLCQCSRLVWFFGSQVSGSRVFLWFLQPYCTCQWPVRVWLFIILTAAVHTLCRFYCSLPVLRQVGWTHPNPYIKLYVFIDWVLLLPSFCLLTHWFCVHLRHVLSKGNHTHALIGVQILSSSSGSVSSWF